MKYFIFTILLLYFQHCPAQKYALIDKQMSLPVIFTNTVTVQNNYAGYFAVEKDKLQQFIIAVEKIAQQISDSKKSKSKPKPFKFTLANITFTGVNISLKDEERLDVMIVSTAGATKSTMHLCDAKLNNSNNAFFVNTWAKYIRDYADAGSSR